jgi:hypothetical protein
VREAVKWFAVPRPQLLQLGDSVPLNTEISDVPEIQQGADYINRVGRSVENPTGTTGRNIENIQAKKDRRDCFSVSQ